MRPAGAGPDAAPKRPRRRGPASLSADLRASGTTMRSARAGGRQLSPVARAARGGLTRRVQTLVIGLVLLVSTGASVLAVALLADSSSPFDRAFAAQHGAHVVATVNTAKATGTQLAATKQVPGVTSAAGPYAEVTVTAKAAPFPGGPELALPPVTLVGRASAGGPLDDLTLQSGHWARGAGQLVLSSDPSPGSNVSMSLGTRFTLASLPGKPVLTVVGIADSVNSSAGGWVLPSEIAKLRTPGTPRAAEMMYRFAHAGSAAAIRTGVAAVSKALPRGTVTGTQSYLAIKAQESSNIGPWVPFVVAFGVLGLVMSVLIVANVVSGAVVAGYQRIGVLKSLGFSPGQVVGAYTGQAGVPAVAGCLGGVVLGNLLSVPILAKTSNVYGVGAMHVPVWVDVVVPVGMCVLVGVAALLPALRAGRLSATAAIAAGRAPRQGRGYGAHRLLGRLVLPRPVTIGLAAPFARPARTAVTLTAILLGAAAVTFAVGLSASLGRVAEGLSLSAAEPVQVMLPSAGPGGGSRTAVHIIRDGSKNGIEVGPPVKTGHIPTVSQAERAVTRALSTQPGTAHWVAAATDQMISVAGLSQQVAVTAFRGDARWTGYGMVSGHWYTGPGQVDVAHGFLIDTGKTVGDTVTMIFGSKQVSARIVGQVFDNDNNGLAMLTSWQTLAGADHGLAVDTYDIGLRPGTSAPQYAQSLGSKLGPAYFVNVNDQDQGFAIVLALIGTLTLLLAIVAGLGVLNTVVLNTRERVHDLGVFKAVGMTPRQTLAMVVCWVAGIGLVAGVIAVPAGIVLHHYVLPAMAAAANLVLPASYLNVYGGAEMAVLALAGLVIAVAAALLPASWAAKAKTASALRTE
jgi:putative ABC transport system permease protein